MPIKMNLNYDLNNFYNIIVQEQMLAWKGRDIPQ
jgi:hypothetical protein